MSLTLRTGLPHTVRGLPPRARRSTLAVVALLLSGLTVSACGGDASAPDPTEADTGVPLNVGSEDPAASPSANDPLTDSSP